MHDLKGLKIGKFHQIMPTATIEPYNRDRVIIGNHVLIGDGSRIITHGPIRPYKYENIIISDLAWLAYGTYVFFGAKIGRGCMIGARSSVFGEIPDYHIGAGNPCKAIRKIKPEEHLRHFVIRILMKRVMGTVEPDWNLLKIEHIKYAFGHNSHRVFDENIDLDKMSVKDVLNHYKIK